MGASECDAAVSKKKSTIVVDEQARSWDRDDFDMDSHGVEAPIDERLESLMRGGYTPEQVSVEIKDRYTKHLEKMKMKGD